MTNYLINKETLERYEIVNESNVTYAVRKDGQFRTVSKADSRFRLAKEDEIPDEEPKLTETRSRCGECHAELGEIACTNEYGGSYCSAKCADFAALKIEVEKAKPASASIIEQIDALPSNAQILQPWMADRIAPVEQVGLKELQFKRNVESILQDLKETLVAKNADYGDSYAKSVEKYGETVMLIRLGDKLSRLESLILSKKIPNVCDESIEDTLKDLAGYAILELERRKR